MPETCFPKPHKTPKIFQFYKTHPLLEIVPVQSHPWVGRVVLLLHLGIITFIWTIWTWSIIGGREVPPCQPRGDPVLGQSPTRGECWITEIFGNFMWFWETSLRHAWQNVLYASAICFSTIWHSIGQYWLRQFFFSRWIGMSRCICLERPDCLAISHLQSQTWQSQISIPRNQLL